MRRSLAWWVLASGAVGCHDAAPARWHVADGALHAPDGRAVILRGVNLSGAQKTSPYLDDKQPADYTRLRADWGFNAVRFIMTWAAVEPAEGQYDDGYLDGVAERLAWADAAGLSVVLDMHEDIYGEGFGFDGAPRWTCDDSRYAAFMPKDPWFLNATDPQVTACVDEFYTHADRRQHFIDAWRHVAARLGTSPAVVGFDLLNEPNWGTYPLFQFERDRLLPLYVDVVAAVRAEAPDWVAFVEPSASRNGGIPTGLTDPLPFADAMYAPHSYDQGAESGSGFDPSHRAQILANVADLAGEATAMGAGLWIGEYGGQATDPHIADYMGAQYDAAGSAAASTMYWAYDKSDGYGLLAPDGTEKTALLAALVRPYPERVSGAPRSYAFDPTTTTFTFTYAPDHGSALPTDIVVPTRVYPNGYVVQCDTCVFQQDAGELHITTPAAGSAATITVAPFAVPD